VDGEQRNRYISLGVREELIRVTGHTKYDTEPRLLKQPSHERAGEVTFWRAGQRVPTIVLGSLRPGEEGVWLDAYSDVYREGGTVRVILAPRHMEKVEYFAQKIAELGIPFSRWSQGGGGARYEDVILLDSMGKLEEAYAIADLAFVGGTLVDIGGHNPLEPAMYAIPVAVGQYTSVIRDIVQSMRGAGGIVEISSARDVVSLVKRVMADDPELKLIGKRGESVWQSHRGAAKRVMSVVAHD
jgi:3-deoxy-D-manno-octulosonic-acid transferase